MTHVTSASGLARVTECPSSVAIAIQIGTTSDAADRGTEKHGFIEAVLSGHKSREDALADLSDESRATCAALDWVGLLEGILPEGRRCEVAYSIDTISGDVRELGVGIGRKYPSELPAHEVPGTLDLEGMCGSRPIVVDFKTGQRVTDCASNKQMQFAAYVAHARTGAEEVVARLTYIDEDGSIFHDEHVFDSFDLITFPAELRDVLANVERAKAVVAAGKVKVSKGEWCRYCPAFDACPAQVALVRSLVPELATIEAAVATLTPEQAGAAWAKWKEIAPMVERVESALKDLAKNNLPDRLPEDGMFTPLVLPDGRGVYAREKSGASFSAKRALELLESYGARPEEIASCTSSYSYVELRAKKFPKQKKAG